MSGFFSSEAEMALIGEEEDLEQLFPPSSGAQSSASTSRADSQAQPSPSYPIPESSYAPHQYWTSLPQAQQSITIHAPYSTLATIPSYNEAATDQGYISTSGNTYLGGSSSYDARSDISQSGSPDPADVYNYGRLNSRGTWDCAYPGCTSRVTFTRACDLRKHYKRHSKFLFCRYDGCPQSTEGGFSSKKDRDRHEEKHNPRIPCEWPDCGRVFSRADNMVWPPTLAISNVLLLCHAAKLTIRPERPS
ncbi:MAG: hypothetical protein M1827_000896 [Pycnora praestabilis]|nr:MAG: hypothetical protein M1827_000896 [Pycnora praestabilis]